MTNEELDKKEQTLYKYKVSNFDIMLPSGNKAVPPDFINSIVIEKDFDNLFFPILKVEFIIDPLTHHMILKYKKEVKFRLRIQKFLDSKDSPPSLSDVFNCVFSSFITSSAPFFDEAEYNKAKEIRNSKDKMIPEEASQKIELYLFKEDDLNNTKKVHNMVYGGLTLTDAICLLYKKSGFGGKSLLMSPLDNTSSFGEMIFPPIPMLGTLKFFEEQYNGFYDEGSVIFFDLEIAYFLKKSSKCTTFRTQEFKQTVFTIRKKDDIQSNKVMCIKNGKEKKFYLYIHPNTLSFESNSIVDDQLYGENVMMVNAATGSTTNIYPTKEVRGSGNTRLLFNTYGNSRYAKNMATDIRESGCIVRAIITDFDTDAILPNKEFIMKFDDVEKASSYNGSYRLSAFNYMLYKNGDGTFSVTGNITLKK